MFLLILFDNFVVNVLLFLYQVENVGNILVEKFSLRFDVGLDLISERALYELVDFVIIELKILSESFKQLDLLLLFLLPHQVSIFGILKFFDDNLFSLNLFFLIGHFCIYWFHSCLKAYVFTLRHLHFLLQLFQFIL